MINLLTSPDTYLLLNKDGSFSEILKGQDWPEKLGNIELLKGHNLNELENLKILKQLESFVAPALESFSDTGEMQLNIQNSSDVYHFEARGIPHEGQYLVRLKKAYSNTSTSTVGEFTEGEDLAPLKKELILQRLEGFRIFGRGVAHDINNPLTYISSSQQRLRKKSEKFEMDEDFRKVVDQAVDFLGKGTVKIKEILQKVSWFAKIDNNFLPEEIETFNLKEMIQETWDAFDVADRLFIEMELTGPDDAEFEGVRSMMKQLFLELFLETYQAMSQDKTTEQMVVKINIEPKENELDIYIEDNGPGHEIEDKAKLFDPFQGRKTHNYGLGLATAWKIAQVHKGELELIVNNPGKVVFKLSF